MNVAAVPMSVESVLVAVDRAGLLALLPEERARVLITPVTRVANGVTLDRDERRAAARALQEAASVLAGPLAQLGVTIPDPPPPVSTRDSRSAHADLRIQLRCLAGNWIGIYGTPFSMRELMLTLPGHEWGTDSAGRKCWKVPATPVTAKRVLETLAPFDPLCSPRVTELAEKCAEIVAARTVLNESNPAPEGDGAGLVNMPLWGHQKRFVAFGEVAPALLFAGRMGSGKTAATIALANKVHAKRILIVSPNRVRRVWTSEVRDRSSVSWHIADGTRPKARGKGRMDRPLAERAAEATNVLFDCDCGAPVHAFCVNYEALTSPTWQQWAPPGLLDLIVYDEVHRIKDHRKTIRRQAAKYLTPEQLAARKAKELVKYTTSYVAALWRANADKVIGLSGTPMPQYPWDIFAIYRAMDPGIFGTVWTDFEKEYIEKDRSGTYPVRIRPDKMGEFAEKVASIMYRPTVDLDLPGYQDVVRRGELEPKAREHYDRLDTELWTDLSRMLAEQRARRHSPAADLDVADLDVADESGELPEVELGGAPAELTAQNILLRLLRLQQLSGGTLRPDPVENAAGIKVKSPEVVVSTAKAEMLAEVLEEVGCVAATANMPASHEPEPVVVFCRFRSDLDTVARVAGKAGLRYGEISGRRNDGLNLDGRMAADVDVVGVQTQAGGTGIDLTRACYAVWYSLGYSVSDYDQARARPYRPGQTRPVTYIHLIIESTRDEAVYDAISQRRAAVSAVLRAGGIEPELVGVREPKPGPDPLGGLELDLDAGRVRLPWE